MISETTLKQIQTKTKDISIDIAKKTWDNKWIIIPALILGYGLIKQKVSLKSLFRKSEAKTGKKKERQLNTKGKAELTQEKKEHKGRTQICGTNLKAKLAQNLTFQEEELSTSCQSETDYRTPPVHAKDSKEEYFLEYQSDIESITTEDLRITQKEKTIKQSTNPDDLFFNLIQQLA